MYDVSAQYVDERMINVYIYIFIYLYIFLSIIIFIIFLLLLLLFVSFFYLIYSFSVVQHIIRLGSACLLQLALLWEAARISLWGNSRSRKLKRIKYKIQK